MKILCLDGGGIRGVFEVAILKALEEEYKRPISQYFDLIAGTSTGSIIATSVVLEKKMSDLLDSYQKFGKKVFKRQAKIGLFKSVYSDKELRTYFKKSFGSKTLADITKPLLIPAVDVTHGKPYVYRTNYGHPGSADLSIKLWDAVLSSCSAPVYFPPNNIKNQYLSVDGGLWANNPALVCITEAIDFFKKDINELKILSIGTGMQDIEYNIERDKYWGIKKWLPFRFMTMKVQPKLLDLALDLSSESISYHCGILLGEKYMRLNKQLGDEMPFDDVKFVDELIELGKQVVEEKREEISQFLQIQ
ncbi:CBASS cGAMP-activated phospholipase [Alkalihalobacillus sp. MEB130]|uniref:CBASS cGAMP-activated phospholipase n=1 Tax=Alkalihalobacillus sp. MEB130 TaxID=2976704 RepID=UPI0028E09B0F|nr:CBASS cGAMP-activated phospholipase [Alkalihalobacillus sp. MEB130]MDT8861071.1 CBASS cGAMP-activated phospholipase [Alkalihalobacillus sp. MEB130]